MTDSDELATLQRLMFMFVSEDERAAFLAAYLELPSAQETRESAITELNNTGKAELVETRTRLTSLEKRVDKIYWLWSAAVFVGTPIMMALSKFVFAKLGL